MKRPLLLLAALGALLAVFRRRSAAGAEADLWTEATRSPDLR
jgi:hypothetical protein